MGRAITAAAEEEGLRLPATEDVTALAGRGLSGRVGGAAFLIGSARLMEEEGIDIAALRPRHAALAAEGRSVFYAAKNGQAAALLAVSDPIKPDAKAAVAGLRAQGREVAIITGDGEATARAVAATLGIERVIAGVLPEGKVDAVRALQEGGPVAFVGDGINDAPALAAADVGIALGTGTDVAVESADVVLMSGALAGVGNAVEISAATLRNIRQNLVWAFGYNAALVPVAAGALYPVNGMLLSPMLAAGAMALSSVFVLSNALRLRRAGRKSERVEKVTQGQSEGRVTRRPEPRVNCPLFPQSATESGLPLVKRRG
uniref:HAD-IC family P-type ATPase n=1 Tax=Litorisediminicola beolgyonensis TaxID=1173614 RepID=UPI0036DA02CA